MLKSSLISAGIVLLICTAAIAAVPNQITYQGRLMKSGLTAAGKHDFQVCFVPATNGCVSFQQVTVPASGDFTLIIDIPPGLNFSSNTYTLQLSVDQQLLSPPDEFTSVPYAIVAATAAYSVTAASAQTAQGLSNPLPATSVQINGTTTLDVWQSTTTPTKMDAAQIDGSLPGQWQWDQGSEKMTYTGGNVGIGTGTSGPKTLLDVEGGIITTGGGLIIETRSGTDPSVPIATGRMWLRTDLP